VSRVLLDQNLSPALASSLRDVFDAVHVRDVGLAAASDDEVWAFAEASILVIDRTPTA